MFHKKIVRKNGIEKFCLFAVQNVCKDTNYINIVQFKIQRYNELKHRATKSLESC